MQFNIFTFTKKVEFQDNIADYQKRLQIKTTITKLKPSNREDGLMAKQEEAGVFLSKRNIKNKLIILDESGDLYDSQAFARWLNKTIINDGNVDFLIGGAFGIDDSIKKVANHKISLSKLTFPHKFIPMLLCEQLYRAFSISNNHPYHKI